MVICEGANCGKTSSGVFHAPQASAISTSTVSTVAAMRWRTHCEMSHSTASVPQQRGAELAGEKKPAAANDHGAGRSPACVDEISVRERAAQIDGHTLENIWRKLQVAPCVAAVEENRTRRHIEAVGSLADRCIGERVI